MIKELDQKFYYKSFRKDRQHSYIVITNLLMELFAPESVIDYGCGLGWILYFLKTRFKLTDLMGIEPNPEVQHELRDEVNEYVYPFSLIYPLKLDRKFDLAISFEVAEHVEAEHADMVVENICRHTDNVVFSSAHPGQGGYGHLNEQPKSYWIERFQKNRFELDERTDGLSMTMRKYGVKPWYWENSMIFKRREEDVA